MMFTRLLPYSRKWKQMVKKIVILVNDKILLSPA